MKTTTKKPAVKKVTTTKVETTTAPKAEVKAPAKAPVKAPVKTEAKSNVNVTSELSKIGAAYTAAINGKMKFSEVKEMFKKLHKEVKKSSKK
jgi:hypothetical protein